MINGLVNKKYKSSIIVKKLTNLSGLNKDEQDNYLINSHPSFSKKLLKLVFSLLILAVTTSCQQSSDKLTIATAANMQYAIMALEQAYERQTGTEVEIILGSSGKLTAQIEQGAPYDLFLSADSKYPLFLYEKGLSTAPPKVYAQGELVLWTSKEVKNISLANLNTENVKQIAMANPKTAPYGKAAEELLSNLDLEEKLKSKLVFGESIAQVNQFISTKTVDLGFTSKSTVIANPEGAWVSVPDSLYLPILQSFVALKNERGMKAQAQAFTDFLLSEEGQKILNKFGYQSPKD